MNRIHIIGQLPRKEGGQFRNPVYGSDGLCPCICARDWKEPKLIADMKVKVANKQGYQIANVGDGIDTRYPSSTTRRGRVQPQSIGALQSDGGDGNAILLEDGEKPKIKRLSPRECGRLMGVSDKDIDVILKYNSNTQAYKQFGNSIVVDVMVEVMRGLLID